MKALLSGILVAVLAIASMSSCQGLGLSPEQKETLLIEVQAQEDEGLISSAEAGMLREILERDGQFDWGALGTALGGIALSIVGAITGVRIQRGPAKPVDPSQASLLKELLATHQRRQEEQEAA